jgi:hypothetical protein
MPVFRNISSAKRTGENGLAGSNGVNLPAFLWTAHAQSGIGVVLALLLTGQPPAPVSSWLGAEKRLPKNQCRRHRSFFLPNADVKLRYPYHVERGHIGNSAAAPTGSGGTFASRTQGGARPQTAEIIKTFGERCQQVIVNNKQEKADYVIVLDHEGGKGYLQRRNKVAVFNKDGDAIVSRSTRSLGNSVQDACGAIVADWSGRGAAAPAGTTGSALLPQSLPKPSQETPPAPTVPAAKQALAIPVQPTTTPTIVPAQPQARATPSR